MKVIDKDCFVSENRNNKLSTKLGLAINAIFSLPKTICVNLWVFPIKTAICLPVLVSYKTKICELHRGSIELPAKTQRFMIKYGFGGSEGIVSRKSSICLEKGSKLCFIGRAVFSEGISVRNAGCIKIGDNFFCNRNCTIWANEEIDIGKDVLFGWNITLRDCDGHLVTHNGVPKEHQKPIIVNNHTWICSEVSLLKGAEIGDDSVVGYGSVVTSKFKEPNILIAGFPAKKIQDGISWVHG